MGIRWSGEGGGGIGLVVMDGDGGGEGGFGDVKQAAAARSSGAVEAATKLQLAGLQEDPCSLEGAHGPFDRGGSVPVPAC